MFSKILIANRGEISCRIMRTCRELGMQTVAIFSMADKESPYTKEADEAYLVGNGNSAPEASYLNMEEIIAIAKRTGSDAIHPGYGFLSQNPEFARRCKEAGICFIGPEPDVMELMADKINAKKAASESGIPVLKGTDNIEPAETPQSVARLGMNFPLMVKANGGGGGIGMALAESKGDVASIIARMQERAGRAFGSSGIYLEEYLRKAAHIEVQVVADQYGDTCHLSLRECSLQRRHQKLVEESPSPKLTRKLRKQLCKAAVNLARRVGYSGVGTVEFLCQDGKFYFLEMNTRLQVEHAVTEMITGIDMVEIQIRIAARQQLQQLRRSDGTRLKKIKPYGHAIEVRIYPEELRNGQFIPLGGKSCRILSFRHGGEPWVRLDSACGIDQDTPIPIEYENLLGKLIVHGRDREQARERMELALTGLLLTEGTNVSFLRVLVSLKDFREGTHHVQTLEDPEVLFGLEQTTKELQYEEWSRRLAYGASLSGQF